MTTSRILLVGLLGAGCLAASGVGGYLAVRSGGVDAVSPTAAAVASRTSAEAADAETAVIDEAARQAAAAPTEPPAAAPAPSSQPTAAVPARRPVTRPRIAPPTVAPAPRIATPDPSTVDPAPETRPELPAAAAAPMLEAVPVAVLPASVPMPAETVIVERDAVIGIRMITAVSSETASVEDRVVALVTRDVHVDGVTAIPAGASLEGTVTVAEPGGKFRDRARIGVQFTAVVLDDAVRIPIETEAIFRDGEAPTGEATSKIGASAVVGTILGAMIGGKKGAAIGGTAGAAGGTAAVMAGGRNAAVIAEGTALTVRLAEPLSMTITREP